MLATLAASRRYKVLGRQSNAFTRQLLDHYLSKVEVTRHNTRGLSEQINKFEEKQRLKNLVGPGGFEPPTSTMSI